MITAVLYREELREYDFGPGHPLQGDRFNNFPQLLKEHMDEGTYCKILAAEPASETDLLRICTQDYINFTRDYFRTYKHGPKNPERFFRYHSADNMPQGQPGKLEEAARLIVGQAKLAADLVMSGWYPMAICIGGGTHHARREYGEGFCLYNDVAFVATYLTEEYGLERVLILDTDAHAGNGTADYFYADPKVLFIDIHQNPSTLYPGTGFAHEIGGREGKGFTINIPLPVYAGNDSYRAVFEEIVAPVTAEFQPQIIIRNGGSDPHFADGLTSLGLTVNGFKMVGEKTRQLAKICDGKEIDLIGSGYNPIVLPYAWLALIAGVADIPYTPEEVITIPEKYRTDSALPETRKVIAEVKKHLKEYWKCLAE